MTLGGKIGLVALFTLIGLAGCNLPESTGAQSAVKTPLPPQYETVSAILTATSFGKMTGVPSLPASESATPSLDATATPQQATTGPLKAPTQAPSPTPTRICDLAQAGVPIDVTIPDDARMSPGEVFTKTWRLVNGGACTWTEDYKIVWFSGDDLGVRREEPFTRAVQPGESVDLSVDMKAPQKPGSFQSNWKLSNPQGGLFGIGPGGGAPFWVRIQVVVQETPTQTVQPATLTPTSTVAQTGTANLTAGQGYDLDALRLSTGPDTDLSLALESEQLNLVPANGALFSIMGNAAPTLAECQAAALSAETIALAGELSGRYVCFKTSQGQPGSLQLVRVDPAGLTLDLLIMVWSVP